MNHEEVLNRILSLQCPSNVLNNLYEFEITLHCVTVKIIAEIGEYDNDLDLQRFKVISFSHNRQS